MKANFPYPDKQEYLRILEATRKKNEDSFRKTLVPVIRSVLTKEEAMQFNEIVNKPQPADTQLDPNANLNFFDALGHCMKE